MRLYIDIFSLLTAFCAFALAFIRVIESINELSKTPDLNTWSRCVQVIKNFFTIERYK